MTDIPDDMGLIGETFVRPISPDLPTLFSKDGLQRLRIENKALWQKIADGLKLISSKKWDVEKDPETRKWKRQPLLLQERYRVARELHKRLYEAIGARDETALQTIACSGLRKQVMMRFANKRATQAPKELIEIEYRGFTSDKLPWFVQTLIPPWFKSTVILTDRLSPLPLGKSTMLRQVIVKVKTIQTLTMDDNSGRSTHHKDELVVLQQITKGDNAEDWKIWGTTLGSSPKEIEALFKQSDGSGQPTLMQRIKNRLAEVVSGPTAS